MSLASAFFAKYWIVFLGTVIFGEAAILPGFVLSGQGVLSLGIVFILAVLGTLTADLFWFGAGTVATAWGKSVLQPERLPKIFRLIDRLLTRFLVHHPVITLTVSKFIIGGRLLTILYLTQKKVNFGRFLISDTVAVICFVSVLALVGWGSGAGFHFFLPHQSNVVVAIEAIVFAALLVWGGSKLFSKELDEKLSKNVATGNE
jgi:membrane protein DedA with SNARE-associated domain